MKTLAGYAAAIITFALLADITSAYPITDLFRIAQTVATSWGALHLLVTIVDAHAPDVWYRGRRHTR